MFVTFAVSVLTTIIAFFALFSPAFSYDVSVIIEGKEYLNPSLINIATGMKWGNMVDFEQNDLALAMMIVTLIGIVITGFCLLFFAFYKKQSGYRIKRMLLLASVGTIFNVADFIIVSVLESQILKAGQDLGLAFVLYNLLVLISIVVLLGLYIVIILRILEAKNFLRFQELILVKQSALPYLKEGYEKDLVLANIKYMKQQNKARYIDKKELQAEKEKVLKLMIDEPHDCECCHDHDHHHHEKD